MSMDGRFKHPMIEGESPTNRKRRLHRIENQKHKLKMFPNRRVGSLRSSSIVTKEYILSQCLPQSETGCWVWQRGKTKGYGSIRENGRHVLVHRRAFELWNGSIPKGLDVLHRCDNPPCCNPSHLFLGTDQDNQDDCYKKGRMPLGVNRPNAKLNENQIKDIRSSPLTVYELAKIYSVGIATISRVKNLVTYKSVP